jgi:hypothetical protein
MVLVTSTCTPKRNFTGRTPGRRLAARRRIGVRSLAVRLAAIAVLAGLVLGAAEVGLRVRRQWIADHLQSPPQDDPRFVADRMLRYRNRPSYAYDSQAADTRDVRYTNNSLGLRGPEITLQKPPGVRRVVLVGGSTVYGALADDSSTISHQLELILQQRLGPNIEVINGGVPGYDSLREVAFACSTLLDLQPDVIVGLDGLNDIFYGTLEEWPSQIAADQMGIMADGRFPDIAAMVDETMFPRGLLEHHLRMLYRDGSRAAFKQLQLKTPAAPRVVSARVVALHAGSHRLLVRHGRQRGSAVIVALQPLVAVGHKPLSPAESAAITHEGYWDVGGWAELAGTMYSRFAASTAQAVEAEGGIFVDLRGAFDNETGTTYAADAAHYTRLGDQRLAEALAPLVEQRLAR